MNCPVKPENGIFIHLQWLHIISAVRDYCFFSRALFEAAVEKQWSDAVNNGRVEGSFQAAYWPVMVMYTTEFFVQKENGVGSSQSWTMKDYLIGYLEMVQMQRGAVPIDVGMVAWLIELNTVEYPNGRQGMIIANGITHRSGSFGTQ